MSQPEDPDFCGVEIEGYKIVESCGSGAIGSVWKAIRSDHIQDVRAIKFFESASRHSSWQEEINKTTQIQDHAPVVSFITSGEVLHDGVEYTWIAWRFVKGSSLKKLIDEGLLTLPLLLQIIRSSLRVLHACKVAGIQHGDLHSGNIMIEDPNPLDIDDSQNRVKITDFGYLTASQGKDMLDDFQGLSVIIGKCLESLDFHLLSGPEKFVFRVLSQNYSRLLLESDPVENQFARNPKELLSEFGRIFSRSPEIDTKSTKSVSDYLAAEILGDRYDEWQALFVPNFIGADRLLERNTTVLTGLRGCGKTTVFRRLTASMNFHLGVCSNVPGADSFVGFYLNARNVAEAFPWFPDDQETVARSQILHFFHSCWTIEVLNWVIQTAEKTEDFHWLIDFFRRIFGRALIVTSSDVFGLREIRAYMERQRDRAKVGMRYVADGWELCSITYLEELSALLVRQKNSDSRPFYYFLDDYSTPLVTAATQRILNSVIFRRSSTAIFKVATESTESLEYIGLNGKVIQLDDDFVLIDSAFESLQKGRSKKNRELLEEILRRRILRDEILSEHATSLFDIIGDTPYAYTDLALQLRGGKVAKSKVLYHGRKVFCDIWCSNTREIIRIFSEMLRLGFKVEGAEQRRLEKKPVIDAVDQNSTLRSAGAKYREVLLAASSPSRKLWEIGNDGHAYGERLVAVSDAFAEVASFELRTKDSKNGDQTPPKQARRIEITDASKADIPAELQVIYQGLIRYGVFLSDARGKSARGKAVDRLVLRGVLLPYYTLSLSKRDSIFMSIEEFSMLLRDPSSFFSWWEKNKSDGEEDSAQANLDFK